MFDSHVHYDHKKFANGRMELLEKMHAQGLEYCLNAAIGFETNEKMIEEVPHIWLWTHKRCGNGFGK